ncbi:hydantoinase/oxoprolinase N-terminal domain-containing protein [Nocardioides daeguensis]|uniref:Hydantoinase/oxoprolinase family protein n=1 Tax=Nocardioides daeguensis TaxID=908359 RepID=A0ABP6V1A8_9ACTN|nr:hydantoinase/oxoprolinase family protein [Nocardioides daeguensis]MBV6727200.1 hydantoinase/oxoprolinase family protein [Nocardioides daeguensis]MCR1771214.1 hydantoinase/oxoprolinase family protein [Nocardioides daeguensis]
MVRIGVDVGGTHTDAVALDGTKVVAKAKHSTTSDVTTGIVGAIRGLLAEGGEAGVPGGIAASDVAAVMIGTTHFTNAFVEGRRLSSVAVVRLGLPATRSVPPMIDWPADRAAMLRAQAYLCHGGHEFDGRPISTLDRAELRAVAQRIGEAGFESVAVSAVFSSVDPSHELAAAEILAAELPGVPLSLSHEIGRVGMLARENATIINASLRGVASETVASFRRAVAELDIAAPIFLSRNDGTLGSLEQCEREPVATFTSGPTNSMRGAALLSQVGDCVVVDIGGTTSDIGVLVNGFPRETSTEALIGEVRTNFRLPDVLSLGIGGGSIVALDAPAPVGPASVGYRLREEALVFGGTTLTATDLAVADGRAEVGDPARVAHLDRDQVAAAVRWLEAQIADGVDRMRLAAAPLPVVLVGGGSVLLREHLAGTPEVVRPENFEAANAVGAAIAQVGTTAERVYAPATDSRAQVIDEVADEATARAVAAGADPATIRVVDVDEVAVAYVPGNPVQLKVRVVGDLPVGSSHA